jgi:hypothetical protein
MKVNRLSEEHIASFQGRYVNHIRTSIKQEAGCFLLIPRERQ